MIQTNEFEFCGHRLGPGNPPVIVAEIGFNHNGDVELAKKMIKAAAEHSADAVKLQTFKGGELYSRNFMANDPDHPGREIPLYRFFERYEFMRWDYEELFTYARQIGIPLFSTPFDEDSLNMLIDLGMPAIKVASPDITHLPFLKRVAQAGLPVVLSTGTATMDEIDIALKTLRAEGNNRIILLHCVSNYPSRYEEMNLACLSRLSGTFLVPVGLSDHTTDNLSGVVAAALGAVMIEKHFTLDRGLPGVDQSISMEPDQLRELKKTTVNVAVILGKDEKTIQSSEIPVKGSARRSLVARVDIAPGTAITPEMLACKRPGTGIPPIDIERVVGRKVVSHISSETVITWDMLGDEPSR